MGIVFAVISGKGGVGKTTTSANLSIGTAMEGKRTAVVDFDIGQRNLDMIWVLKIELSMILPMLWMVKLV